MFPVAASGPAGNMEPRVLACALFGKSVSAPPERGARTLESHKRPAVEIDLYARGTIGTILHSPPRTRGAVTVCASRRPAARDDPRATAAPLLPCTIMALVVLEFAARIAAGPGVLELEADE